MWPMHCGGERMGEGPWGGEGNQTEMKKKRTGGEKNVRRE